MHGNEFHLLNGHDILPIVIIDLKNQMKKVQFHCIWFGLKPEPSRDGKLPH